MERQRKEFYVGFFVLIGLAAVGYLVLVLGQWSLFGSNQYSLYGYFSSVAGLKTGARVETAGVEIGQVSGIAIDTKRLVAKVSFRIDENIKLSDDSIASVKTSGIIGEKYVDILPGGSPFTLENGDEIENTESAVDIESLVRKYIFSNEKKVIK